MIHRGKITLLLFFFAVCGTAALVNYYWQLRAERVRPTELYSVIYNQFADFRADDFPRAYQHASSGFQQKFNLTQFADLIRSDDLRVLAAVMGRSPEDLGSRLDELGLRAAISA